MCGIAGIWAPNSDPAQSLEIVRAMATAILHRGPDSDGVWQDADAGLAFGHRRLAIVDLSPAGHQPMTSASGRYTITYNGEIYNFPALRAELEAAGHTFNGHSDTEVLLEAIARWGMAATLPRLDGIFAFGLWDARDRTLHLARDHAGIKPLYWSRAGKTLLFASEIKALHAHPAFDVTLNRDAVASFLRFNYVPGPTSIYQHTNKIEPGTFLTLRADGSHQITEYWNAFDAATKARGTPFTGTDTQAIDRLEALLGDTVASQMISDVPLGAFLSGGVDSSAIVAMMQRARQDKVRTFSIGFNEDAYDEARHAKAVAAHLGTDHTELYVTANDALNVVPVLPDMYDEPFADSSQIPTYLVSHMTRQHVTVSLSGDAGDELFGGYNRYFWARNIWNRIGWMPPAMRRAAAAAMCAMPPVGWDTLAGVIPGRHRPPQVGDKVHKLAGMIKGTSEDDVYRHLVSHWPDPEAMVPGGHEPATGPGAMFAGDPKLENFPDFTQRMQILDTRTYLPGDILTKVDRASMATSLEARVPYLSPALIDFAWSLPDHMKIRGQTGKWILREVLYRHVPRALIERPKQGFGVPIADWLRGPLRPWAEDLLDETKMREAGLLNPTPIRKAWDEHLSGRRNWQYHLWGVLMLQAWLARWPHRLA